MTRLTRSLLVGLLALPLPSGGAALLDPLPWLRAQGQATSARFELAHATYSVWRVRWKQPAADLQLVFASNARAPGEAGQLRELTVNAFAPRHSAFTPAQRRALQNAARTLARACGLGPVGAPEVLDAQPGTASAVQLSVTVRLPTGARPGCVTPEP